MDVKKDVATPEPWKRGMKVGFYKRDLKELEWVDPATTEIKWVDSVEKVQAEKK